MKKIPSVMLILWLAGCALTPEQQAARLRAIEAQEKRLELMFAARCDSETARLLALQQQQWAGASDAERAAYAERIANPVYQSCVRLARENYLYEQHLREMENLEWRLEMRRETDWLMGQPFYHYPYGYGRWRW